MKTGSGNDDIDFPFVLNSLELRISDVNKTKLSYLRASIIFLSNECQLNLNAQIWRQIQIQIYIQILTVGTSVALA